MEVVASAPLTLYTHESYQMKSRNSKRNPRKLVAYYRVSTKKQEQSGLGLEAQRTAVSQYAQQNGGTVVAEYTETETGKRSDQGLR